jgi:phosphatidate phosphatase LPIN
LNLARGKNSVSFSVTSSFAGKATCTAHMYYWKHNVPVVISDIDGTITKFPVHPTLLKFQIRCCRTHIHHDRP